MLAGSPLPQTLDLQCQPPLPSHWSCANTDCCTRQEILLKEARGPSFGRLLLLSPFLLFITLIPKRLKILCLIHALGSEALRA